MFDVTCFSPTRLFPCIVFALIRLCETSESALVEFIKRLIARGLQGRSEGMWASVQLCLLACVIAHVGATPASVSGRRSFRVTCWNESSDGESAGVEVGAAAGAGAAASAGARTAAVGRRPTGLNVSAVAGGIVNDQPQMDESSSSYSADDVFEIASLTAIGAGTAFLGHDVARARQQSDSDEETSCSDDCDAEEEDTDDEVDAGAGVSQVQSTPAAAASAKLKTHTVKKRHWPRRPRRRARDLDEGRWHRMMANYSGGEGARECCCKHHCLNQPPANEWAFVLGVRNTYKPVGLTQSEVYDEIGVGIFVAANVRRRSKERIVVAAAGSRVQLCMGALARVLNVDNKTLREIRNKYSEGPVEVTERFSSSEHHRSTFERYSKQGDCLDLTAGALIHAFIVDWGPVHGLCDDDSSGMLWRILALPEMTLDYVYRCFVSWLPGYFRKHDVSWAERPALIQLPYFRRFFGKAWKKEQGARIQLLHKGTYRLPSMSVFVHAYACKCARSGDLKVCAECVALTIAVASTRSGTAERSRSIWRRRTHVTWVKKTRKIHDGYNVSKLYMCSDYCKLNTAQSNTICTYIV